MTQEKFANLPRPRLDDRPLWDVMFGVFGYPALLIAHRLKLFALLESKALTLPDICNELNIKRRPAEAMLTTATALGFLSLKDKYYALTPLAEDYLLEKSPSYFGFFWDMMIDNSQVFSLASLERAVLTDCPQAYGGGDIYKSHEEQVELARRLAKCHRFKRDEADARHWRRFRSPFNRGCVEIEKSKSNHSGSGAYLRSGSRVHCPVWLAGSYWHTGWRHVERLISRS
jgi:hypothetical protein